MNPGEISGLVPTQYGFHVIKLDAVFKGEPCTEHTYAVRRYEGG